MRNFQFDYNLTRLKFYLHNNPNKHQASNRYRSR